MTRIKIVKLSETVIHVVENQYRDRDFKLSEIFYTLDLTHNDFGNIKVTEQDFKNINEISLQFRELIEDDARYVRQKRLLKKELEINYNLL